MKTFHPSVAAAFHLNSTTLHAQQQVSYTDSHLGLNKVCGTEQKSDKLIPFHVTTNHHNYRLLHEKYKHVVNYLQSSRSDSVVDEAPSDGQPSCRQSVQTTSRWTSSAADWNSTAVQTEYESTAVHSSVERQICPT